MRYFLILCTILSITACNKDEPVDFNTKNDQEIQEYIANNNLNAQSSGTGLYYVIDSIGNGKKPSRTDNVTVAYKGYFTNGRVFDESDSKGIRFNLQQVIDGWTEGITYFSEGGSGLLLIPSRLGYGTTARSGIPAGSVLIFEINLIKVR